MSHGQIILLMTVLFLVFGYMGVPVAFALMAGVLVACMMTPISMQSMIGQMFHGIDSEILLAVPFSNPRGRIGDVAGHRPRVLSSIEAKPCRSSCWWVN